MTLLIVLSSIAVYLTAGAYIARPVYLFFKDVHAREMKEWNSQEMFRFLEPSDDSALMAAVTMLLWPFALVARGIARFFNAPIRKRKEVRDELAEQLTFWRKQMEAAAPGTEQHELASVLLEEVGQKLKEYT